MTNPSSKYKRFRNIAIWSIGFIAFTVLTIKGAFKKIDAGVADIMSIYTNPVSDTIFSALRSLGQPGLCIIIAFVTAAYMFFKKSKRLALLFIITFILLLATSYELKNAIRKERPQKIFATGLSHPAKGFSYPSGHSSRTFYLFFALAILAKRARLSKRAKEILRGALYSLILLVGFSSMYLGAHWLSDIIGAYILGYISILVLKGAVGEGSK